MARPGAETLRRRAAGTGASDECRTEGELRILGRTCSPGAAWVVALGLHWRAAAYAMTALGPTLIVSRRLALTSQRAVDPGRDGRAEAHFGGKRSQAPTLRAMTDTVVPAANSLLVAAWEVLRSSPFLEAVTRIAPRTILLDIDDLQKHAWLGPFDDQVHVELRSIFPSADVIVCPILAGAERERAAGIKERDAEHLVVLPHISRRPVILNVMPRRSAPRAQVCAYVFANLGGAGVVFCRSRPEAQRLDRLLSMLGIRAASDAEPNSGGGGSAVRSAFLDGKLDVLVTTSGSGADACRSDLRYVLHCSMPTSLAAYARDLEVCANAERVKSTLLFPEHADNAKLARSKARSQPGGVRVGDDVRAYCQTNACRHLQLLRLIQPDYTLPHPRAFNCRSCDICIGYPRGCCEDGEGPLWQM